MIQPTAAAVYAPWPPPSAVRKVLCRLRRRYHAMASTGRPSLARPLLCVGMFRRHELVALATQGFWPLPPRAKASIARHPAPPQRRRRRWIVRAWVEEGAGR
jgi:hypothetical protein